MRRPHDKCLALNIKYVLAEWKRDRERDLQYVACSAPLSVSIRVTHKCTTCNVTATETGRDRVKEIEGGKPNMEL